MKKSKNKLASIMSPALKIFCLTVVLLNIFFASFIFFNSDLHFKSDVARDMLLFQEISEKKIVFLGPRASGIMGLYHGPLWLYLTYPAYLIGQGDPVVLGWYWMVLIVLGLIGNYYIAKNLFSETVAWIFLIFLSSFLIPELKGLYNPHGAFLLLPAWYYVLVRYLETAKWKYLFVYLIMAGMIIQFQMAVGLPLTFLSIIIVVAYIFKKRNWRHLLVFPTILIPLSSFLIFELRHNFAQLTAIINPAQFETTIKFDLNESMKQRFRLATSSTIQIFRGPLNILATVPTLIFIWFGATKLSNIPTRERNRYLLFIYLLLGTWLMTLMIPGKVLPHQWVPLISLSLLLFASLIKYIDKRIFMVLIGLLIFQNVFHWNQELIYVSTHTGLSSDSWAFQRQLIDWIVTDGEPEFGYFVYAPDIYAYGPKYTMLYLQKKFPNIKVASFEKKPVTYVLSEPPPKDRSDLSPLEWRKSKFGITSEPVRSIAFPNGYLIEKFELDQEEINVPVDGNLDTGVFFR